MLSEPLSITYNSVAKSLARVSTSATRSRFRTSDGEFECSIRNYPVEPGNDTLYVGVILSRIAPDPTPSDVFDPYRNIRNSVELRFGVDTTRYEASTVIPLLRTALNSFLDTTMTNRIIAGEK